jgi:LL-diaminopimelate aminotransferase
LHSLWHRRFSTKFNSVSYPVQCGAASLYSKAGQEQIRSLIDHYLANARLLATSLQKTGLTVYGGSDAPYIWVKAPSGYGSWAVFDKILHEIQVVITPGAGFGTQGEGFFRVSAFNSRENAEAVAERFQKVKW